MFNIEMGYETAEKGEEKNWARDETSCTKDFLILQTVVRQKVSICSAKNKRRGGPPMPKGRYTKETKGRKGLRALCHRRGVFYRRKR